MTETVSIDLLEYENNILKIDGSVDRDISMQVKLNGLVFPFRYTKRHADVVLRDKTLTDRTAFVVEIPVKKLAGENQIDFCSAGKNLPVITGGYQSRVCSTLEQSYWCFDRFMVTLSGRAGKEKQEIRIRKAGRPARIRQEICLIKEMLRAPYGSKKMAAVRLQYWLSRPVYRRKRIWVTFDKLYKGGDCGEYFYKYMVSQKSSGIEPVYILKKDAPDFARLEKEGFHPAAYRSRKQRLQYLNAEMVFGTHSGVNSFCGFNNWEIQFIQDRLKMANACIQHGLTVQDLSADSHRTVNNNKRYYCASESEIRNLSAPSYDYAPEVLRLTGIPRYDGLTDQSHRQILITPTWRSYIAMPSVMGSARPYNPDFKETDYYRIFQKLLENKTLSETAQRLGYRIIYLLHPVISAQKKDFHPGKGIEIRSALESNYEQLLTQSSLMVTDYSGVQFDFAYMRKPVLYFHPDQLPPHYENGSGFSYTEQGFGEICKTETELADLLCDYMEQECKMKAPYRERADRFFAYADHNSCARIFADAKDFADRRRK